MTSPGHHYKIKHPGYDKPGNFNNRKYDFIFSDDIRRWIRTGKPKEPNQMKHKGKSKSKTFEKGTDFQEVADFLSEQIETTPFDLGNLDNEDDCQTTSKYLITITKLERP